MRLPPHSRSSQLFQQHPGRHGQKPTKATSSHYFFLPNSPPLPLSVPVLHSLAILLWLPDEKLLDDAMLGLFTPPEPVEDWEAVREGVPGLRTGWEEEGSLAEPKEA
jgi:hypothetical protein